MRVRDIDLAKKMCSWVASNTGMPFYELLQLLELIVGAMHLQLYVFI